MPREREQLQQLLYSYVNCRASCCVPLTTQSFRDQKDPLQDFFFCVCVYYSTNFAQLGGQIVLYDYVVGLHPRAELSSFEVVSKKRER